MLPIGLNMKFVGLAIQHHSVPHLSGITTHLLAISSKKCDA